MNVAGEAVPDRQVVVNALYVETNGAYASIPGVIPWDITRDARLYAGPGPVIVHPPCSRWCRLAGLVEARWGHKVGDDGGIFARALEQVRLYGGHLEHPAHSKAWPAYHLRPPAGAGWHRGLCGGWTTRVDQGQYGHLAKKATWLYAYGVHPGALPELDWSDRPGSEYEALVSWCANRVRAGENRPRVGKAAAAATPPAFRQVLLDLARAAG
jgi:hypothetical protein